MVTRDRIRLTGLLREKPWKRGFSYWLQPRYSSRYRRGSRIGVCSARAPHCRLPACEVPTYQLAFTVRVVGCLDHASRQPESRSRLREVVLRAVAGPVNRA